MTLQQHLPCAAHYFKSCLALENLYLAVVRRYYDTSPHVDRVFFSVRPQMDAMIGTHKTFEAPALLVGQGWTPDRTFYFTLLCAIMRWQGGKRSR